MNIKKTLSILTIIVICCGCSSIGSNVAPGYSDAYKLFRNYIYGTEDNIDKELIENIPYASMKLRIGKGPTGLLILEQKLDNVEYWVSSDGVYIVIKNGRVIETSGLENNLIRTTSHENSLNERRNYTYLNSYDEPKLDSFEVTASLKKLQVSETELVVGKRNLQLFEEIIINKYTGWKRVNHFWIDSEGFVWKSVQNVSPKLPPLFIEITKRPS